MAVKPQYQWLQTGEAFYAALLAAIAAADRSVRLETYIYTRGHPGDAVRDALLAAVRRGVKVQVLVDAFGAMGLASDYWAELRTAGGECLVFNPLAFLRLACRNHRKLLVCDELVAFVGGFNISHEEAGDGITRGWRDLGLRLTGPLAAELALSFDQMFAMAAAGHCRLSRFPRGMKLPPVRQLPVLLRRAVAATVPAPAPPGTVLISHPGRVVSPIKRALIRDLAKARTIRIVSAYFLPSWRLRKLLTRAAKSGADVQLVTAGRSDVPLARLAGRTLYQHFLRAGIRIYEYQPQILHTKLIIIDNTVYVGSANLDARSLNINHELLVRLEDHRLAHVARRIFQDHLHHSRQIDPDSWQHSRGLWEKFKERIAYIILARIDPYFAHRQLPKLR